MGDSSLLGPDDVVALVDASEQDVAEVNGPDPVVGLLEADRMLLERVGEEQQALLQANRARVGDTLDEEVAGVLDGGQRAGVGPRGGPVQRGRRAIAQCCVRPFVIVEVAEGGEGTLLGGEAGVGRATRLVAYRVVWKFRAALPVLFADNREPVSFRSLTIHSRIALAWSKYM